MIAGDPYAWKAHFITLDERFLSRVLLVWPACVALLAGQPEEDFITINLVDRLSQDAVVRRICYMVVYQHEPFGTHPGGAKFSKGRIDLAVLLGQDREKYLAYECKRLNVIYRGARSSLATRYVKEGMMKFLTEQYAEGLPVGCMLGYIMDGDLPFALTQVSGAIDTHRTPLRIVDGASSSEAVPGIERFSTFHQRNSSIIELRHALLPFSTAKDVTTAFPQTEATEKFCCDAEAAQDGAN
jgi:hypothetical protein